MWASSKNMRSRSEVGQPEINIRAAIQGKTGAPEDRIITAVFPGESEGGGSFVEDDPVPVLPNMPEAKEAQCGRRVGGSRCRERAVGGERHTARVVGRRAHGRQIGRASCRERVCLYV